MLIVTDAPAEVAVTATVLAGGSWLSPYTKAAVVLSLVENVTAPGCPTGPPQSSSGKTADVTSGTVVGAEASTVNSHHGLQPLTSVPSSARTRHEYVPA